MKDMQKIVIEGRRSLEGVVNISGSKNASLPIMAATLLTSEICSIRNLPNLRDIDSFSELMNSFGANIDKLDHAINICCDNINNLTAHYDLVKKMRASILVLGPMVARFARAKVSLPGGCAIGLRPINLHIDALKKMGATGSVEKGYIILEAPSGLHGADIYFPKITVTGTENILMAASLAKGRTIIHNAAKEPEVVALANILNKMGAYIYGAGTDKIVVDGVERLGGFEEAVIYDRIETGTFIAAVAAAKGEVLLKNAKIDMLECPVSIFDEMGVIIEKTEKGVKVSCDKGLKPANIYTAPYPGFPTDLQAQIMADLSLAYGTSIINENIFENRFMHVAELSRMGADIKVSGKQAVVKGVKHLTGANVMATDLRASASLVVAGLAANGTTVIDRAYHIDRGYESIEKKLQAVGARIWRES